MAEAVRTGVEGLEEDLAREREAVAGRSPPYERALALLPDVLEGAPRRFLAAAWEGRRFVAWYDRPLLLLAAMRHDALAEGPGHPLWEAFASPAARADAVGPDALAAALDARRDRVWDAVASRGVKTNETSRAVAWLWPAALAGASRGGRLLAVADVGASAGLNLVADALPAPWTDEAGAPLEVARDLRIVARLGMDPEPLDAGDAGDVAWLRACVWPGEPERLERLERAVEAFRAARPRPDAPVLVPIAARDVPARLELLAEANPGALVLAFQTVMRDYVEPEERAEYEGGMRGWLAARPPGAALWVTLEGAEGAGPDGDAAIVATVRAPWGEVRALELARCAWHPTRVVRRPEGVAALREALAARPAEEGRSSRA